MSEAQKTKKAVDPILELKAKRVTVLSLEEGPFFIPESRRDTMCLLSNYMLCIQSGQENSHDVLSYIQLLRHRNITPKTRMVSTSALRRLYAELNSKNEQGRGAQQGQQTSTIQKEVITIISDAVRRKASDIHITVHDGYGEIAFRIHGDLYKVQEPPQSKCEDICATIYQSMCTIAEPTYKPNAFQDARMSADFVERCGLFGSRIASGPTDAGSRMVIRLLYSSGGTAPTLKELGYLPEHVAMIDTMRRQTSGINVLSGATGSGKSTTLVSVLDSIIQGAKSDKKLDKNNEVEQFLGVSVSTIEDPPEYKIAGANQTPLIADKTNQEDIKAGWARAISANMRMDPDVIMVGEIRDPGSAKAAFDAALTGHGVWTTVHTTDAVGIMLRLKGLNIDSDRMLDPEIITGLINQSLAQKLCPYCSIPWSKKREELAKHDPGFVRRIENYCLTEGVRVRGDGCEKCKFEGISGRVVVAEIIIPDLAFMEMFDKEGKAHAKAYWVKEMGGITKCMSMIRRINQGMIDPAEGEDKICPVNKDNLTLNLDYSKQGDFESARKLTYPKAHLEPKQDFIGSIEDASDLYFKVYAQRNEKEGHN